MAKDTEELREYGLVHGDGTWWECPRCGALLGAGVEVCDLNYDSYTPHPPVYRPEGVSFGEEEL